jgi:hypothetical protein
MWPSSTTPACSCPDELGELATADPAAARINMLVHLLALVLDGIAAKGEK